MVWSKFSKVQSWTNPGLKFQTVEQLLCQVSWNASREIKQPNQRGTDPPLFWLYSLFHKQKGLWHADLAGKDAPSCLYKNSHAWTVWMVQGSQTRAVCASEERLCGVLITTRFLPLLILTCPHALSFDQTFQKTFESLASNLFWKQMEDIWIWANLVLQSSTGWGNLLPCRCILKYNSYIPWFLAMLARVSSN